MLEELVGLWQCGLNVYLAAILRAVQFLLEGRKRCDLNMYLAAVQSAVTLLSHSIAIIPIHGVDALT